MIQTWLPYPDFKASISCLTDLHLGAMRLHCLELLEALHTVEESHLDSDYVRSPKDVLSKLVLMWMGHELQLCEFALEACDEWAMRKGRRDPYYSRIANHLEWGATEEAAMVKPIWFGEIEFHLGHQAALVREDPDHYKRYFKVDAARELVWPKANG